MGFQLAKAHWSLNRKRMIEQELTYGMPVDWRVKKSMVYLSGKLLTKTMVQQSRCLPLVNKTL